jgi:hypothetical protein
VGINGGKGPINGKNLFCKIMRGEGVCECRYLSEMLMIFQGGSVPKTVLDIIFEYLRGRGKRAK